MQPFPHHYPATAVGSTEGNVLVSSAGVMDITTAALVEFDREISGRPKHYS